MREDNRVDALLTPEEAALLLGVKRRTVTDRRWLLRVGLFPCKIGRLVRFRPADVKRLVDRNLSR